MSANESHPENSPALHIELPRSFEDQFETRKQAIHQALGFGLVIPILTFIAAGAVLLFSHELGGPRCTAGVADYLCSHTFEILFPVITCGIAFGGVIACAIMVWVKFRRYQHWSPWLGCLWGLIPFSLFWAISTLAAILH
ncbi:MAG: hypothetical protein Q3962_08775 [Corynebacterium sp.]|nr:hypothetical protein [Corynebacterium sp.]